MRDPVRILPGDVLVFSFDPGDPTPVEVLARNAAAVLERVRDAGVTGVTALILSQRLTVAALTTEVMRDNGWVRPEGWSGNHDDAVGL